MRRPPASAILRAAHERYETATAVLRPKIGTRRRRAETHPLRTGLQRRRVARDPGRGAAERDLLTRVDARIAPRDEMYVGDGEHYFSVGLSAVRCIEAALPSPPARILDMPCGHGRVLRFLRARFPAAEVIACDLDSDGAAFCAGRFGAQPVVSSPDLATVELPGPFDLIWCGSLVTHLDADANAALLDLFARSLAHGGVAVVTTHGSLVADRLRSGQADYQLTPSDARAVAAAYDAGGFGYADYPWSPGYGVSASSRAWIEALAAGAGLRVTGFTERGWDDHQDVVALMRA